MTKHIHIFGNSHLAAVQDGYHKFAGRWPEFKATFIGAHKDGLAEVTSEGGILTPYSKDAIDDFERLAGVKQVDLRDSAAIVIVGAGFAPIRAAMIYHRARWAELSSVTSNPDPSPDWFLVSKPAFSAMLQSKLLEEAAGRLIRILKRDIDTPIFLVSQPRATTRIMEIGKHRLDIVRTAIKNGDGLALSDMYEANAGTISDALGVTYIAQNPRTISQDFLTAEAFSKGAIRLAKLGRFSQPKEDVLHANASYGKVVLDQIKSALIRQRILPRT